MENDIKENFKTSAIKSWVDSYADLLYSWALHKTSSKESAEDLVQDTFMAATQSFEKFKGDSDPKTWLFSILNHKIQDYYRNLYRRPVFSEASIFEKLFDDHDRWKVEERPSEWPGEPGHLLDDPGFREILMHCLKNLPPSWHSAIQLKFLEEKKGDFICQELGITDTNFWQILHRAKLQLRRCLELNWFKK